MEDNRSQGETRREGVKVDNKARSDATKRVIVRNKCEDAIRRDERVNNQNRN